MIDQTLTSFHQNRRQWIAFIQKKLFGSLAKQIQYTLVILVILTTLITGTLLTQLSFQTQLEQSLRLEQIQSELAAEQINRYLDDLQRKISYLARLQGLTELSKINQQRLLEALTHHNSAYEMVALLDAQGDVVVSVSAFEKVELKNQINAPLFIKTFKQKEDYVSPVEIDPKLQVPMVTLAVPVRNNQDKIDGVLLAKINLKFLWFVVSKIQIGKTGYVYILDNRYRIIALKGSAPEVIQIEDISHKKFIKKLIENPSIISQSLNTYRGLKGVEVIGAVSSVRSVRWKVMVEFPITEAYAPVYQMIRVMLLTLFFITLFAGLLGSFLTRAFIAPLRRLTKAAIQIREGNLQTVVEINSSQEMQVLATTFNQMTQRLYQVLEDLEKERNFVSSVLETAGALFVVLDRHGKIIRFNQACEKATGFSFEEVKQQFFWDFVILPEDIHSFQSVFQNLEENLKFMSHHENYWLTKTGETRLISWSNTVLLDAANQVDYIISIGIDITEQKQAEELRIAKETAETALRQLQQTQTQLIQTEKMSSLGQLVAGVAHEINNPVNFILGNLSYTESYIEDLLGLVQLYQKYYPEEPSEIKDYANTIELDFLKEDFKQMIASMKAGSNRISQIVLSLRNFSRLDESAKKKVDIHEGIESTLLILQSRLKLSGIQVIKKLESLPLVECYAGDINQVFLNIIQNSIDALNEAKEVQSQNANLTENQKLSSPFSRWQATLEIHTKSIENNWIQIKIIDNGRGIPSPIQSKIFDPFFTTKPIGTGTGLGLSISYQIIVEKHKGRLICHSEIEQGTELIIEIPTQSSSQLTSISQ